MTRPPRSAAALAARSTSAGDQSLNVVKRRWTWCSSSSMLHRYVCVDSSENRLVRVTASDVCREFLGVAGARSRVTIRHDLSYPLTERRRDCGWVAEDVPPYQEQTARDGASRGSLGGRVQVHPMDRGCRNGEVEGSVGQGHCLGSLLHDGRRGIGRSYACGELGPGSTAVTCIPASSSGPVACPVPAPRSTALHPGSSTPRSRTVFHSSTGYGGRASPYRSACISKCIPSGIATVYESQPRHLHVRVQKSVHQRPPLSAVRELPTAASRDFTISGEGLSFSGARRWDPQGSHGRRFPRTAG